VLIGDGRRCGRDGWITSLTISTHAGDEFYVVLHMNEHKLRRACD
jgi:hypothetical protein